MAETRKFTFDTLNDAKSVVRQVFGEGACHLLDKFLKNPVLHDLENPDSGELVYADDEPVGFEAIMPRVMYYGNQRMLAGMGSTLCLLEKGRKSFVLLDLMPKIVMPRFGSVLYCNNTTNLNGFKVNKALGLHVDGPDSYANKRIAIVRPLGFFLRLIKTKLLKLKEHSNHRVKEMFPHVAVSGFTIRRLKEFDDSFDAFWKRYLAANKGLVASRTVTELQWAFGAELAAGEVILCGIFNDETLCGYAVLSGRGSGCKVLDMLVMNNDSEMLSALLKGILKIIRRCTSATSCSISGFPDYVQPTIAEVFTIKRPLANNMFGWKFLSPETFDVPYEKLNSPDSWFFGPYDGDDCLL